MKEILMELTLKILKAQVLLCDGADLVLLQVDKPSPFPPDVSDDPLNLTFRVEYNRGPEYCLANFGIFPEIINTRSAR